MPADLNIYRNYLEFMMSDERISHWHVAVVTAILLLSDAGYFGSPIKISRRKVMRLAHIGSFMTYHKCIRDLQQWGYIQYIPSYHPALGSRVVLMAGAAG